MGYLSNSSIEIDAVLTNKGRALLSNGTSQFKITKFAVADDEIDYSLWNPNHTLGSAYYGEVIENLPIIEASPNENHALKYKLVTLDKNTIRIPVLSIGQGDVVLQSAGQTYTLSPDTINYPSGNKTYGYTAILSNSDTADIYPAPGSSISTNYIPEYTEGLSTQSVYVVAHKFEIRAKRQTLSDGTATITVIGNETGGRVVLNLTVKQETVATI